MRAPANSSRARWRTVLVLAWTVLAMSGPALELVTPATTDRTDWQWPFGLLIFAPAGAMILIRRPRNRIGLVLAATASASALIFIGGWFSRQVTAHVAAALLEHLANAGVFISFWGLISLLHLFPDGVTLGRGWRSFYRAFSLFVLGVVPILPILRSGPMDISGRPNPFGIDAEWPALVLDWGLVALPIGAAVGVASLVARYRRAGGVERAQLKTFAFASVMVLVLMAIISVVPEDVNPLIDAALRPLVVLGFWALPVAIVAAILRYRLYDIDRIVSRSVTYLIVVALLGFGYVGSLLALQTLLPLEGSAAVAAATLAMASMLAPLRRRVQRAVDRRFFRARYDAEALVTDMAGMVRTSVDLSELQHYVTGTVGSALEPTSVSLWVRPAHN